MEVVTAIFVVVGYSAIGARFLSRTEAGEVPRIIDESIGMWAIRAIATRLGLRGRVVESAAKHSADIAAGMTATPARLLAAGTVRPGLAPSRGPIARRAGTGAPRSEERPAFALTAPESALPSLPSAAPHQPGSRALARPMPLPSRGSEGPRPAPPPALTGPMTPWFAERSRVIAARERREGAVEASAGAPPRPPRTDRRASAAFGPSTVATAVAAARTYRATRAGWVVATAMTLVLIGLVAYASMVGTEPARRARLTVPPSPAPASAVPGAVSLNAAARAGSLL